MNVAGFSKEKHGRVAFTDTASFKRMKNVRHAKARSSQGRDTLAAPDCAANHASIATSIRQWTWCLLAKAEDFKVRLKLPKKCSRQILERR